MLSHFKNIVKKNEADIVLVVGVILVALISFGAGRLTVSSDDKAPIIIKDPIPAASVQQSLEKNLKKESKENDSEIAKEKEKKFVASVKSDKYHWPWCPSAKKIKIENQIWFESESEAQSAGYTPGSKFEELTPK